MFDNGMYITITGMDYFFGKKPFSIGAQLTLRKDPENDYDGEAIVVIAPVLGKVGYVANSPKTTAGGTMSAGRLYDFIQEECMAIVRFTTVSKVIAQVFPDKRLKVKVEVALEEAIDAQKSANIE